MHWRLHDDGSFDLITAAGSLLGAWPGIDHSPVRARRVEVGANRIDYHLSGAAVLTLEFADGELRCTLVGMDPAPYWIHPLCDATVAGFDRLFRQGQGFSGPSGFVPIPRRTHRGLESFAGDVGDAGGAWTLDSYLLAGLAGAGGVLVMGPLDHRRFLWKADLHNRSIRGSFRNREVHENLTRCEFGFRCEGVPTGGTLHLPPLRFRFGDAFDTLRAQALEVAAAYAITLQPPTFHYCSWYHKIHFFARHDLDEVLAGLADVDPSGQVQTVQIDDGYMTSHGDWLDPKPWLWPGGMEPAIRAITATGRRAGIWLALYSVGSNSRIAREHPDWLLHRTDGTLVVQWRHWDGTRGDFEHYVLDTSHPDAMQHLLHTVRTFRAWGVRFWKTDFLEWGYQDSTTVRRHTPGKTAVEYVRDLMVALREEMGPDSHWLACISHFAPMLGLVDGMRVASDVGLRWDGAGGTGNDGTGGGTQNMIEEMFATQYFNRVLWENDPDVAYLRDYHVHHEDGAWQALAAYHGILGVSINVSDEIHRYPAERRAWFDFLRPGDTEIARLPWFDRPHPFRVAVRAYAGGWGVLLLNDGREARYGRCSLSELVGLSSATCYRWGPGIAEAMGTCAELALELPGHRHLLVYISRDGQPPPPDLTLGGARG